MTESSLYEPLPPLPPDAEIARAATPRPIEEVAIRAGLRPEELEPYGSAKAKVHPSAWERVKNRPDGKLILVTAMTATRFGEGKTVTSIGLSQAFGQLGVNALTAIRQPSLGPAFGIKGGAAGGGHAQAIPMEEINLHFTGDFHAITMAHNLLAACTDNVVHHGNRLRIEKIAWRRVMDLCDRQLRHIVAGNGGSANGWPHESGFDITAASEIMACVALATDLEDLRGRLERIIVGYRAGGEPVFAREIGCVGAMMALLRDTLKPNLVQTLEGTPVLIHGGPFGNIAHGCNSLVATRLALKLADYVVTEAGFAADLGAEKFIHIKCRQGGFRPDAAVLVVSCRALRAHGLEDGADWSRPDVEALRRGLENVRVHLENLDKFGVPAIVATNRFPDDDPAELDAIADFARARGTGYALSEVVARGGEAGIELAREIMRVADNGGSNCQPIYELSDSVESKIETLARDIYRADGIDYDDKARESLALLEQNGLTHLPICMAKTQLSISDDPKRLGAPEGGWRLRVRDIRASNGAGFLVVIAGRILLMPGMPEHGAFERIELDDDGFITGLS